MQIMVVEYLPIQTQWIGDGCGTRLGYAQDANRTTSSAVSQIPLVSRNSCVTVGVPWSLSKESASKIVGKNTITGQKCRTRRTKDVVITRGLWKKFRHLRPRHLLSISRTIPEIATIP